MPIHFLELASVSPNGTAHTHTQTWRASPHCESATISPLHTDSHSRAHTLSPPVGMTARKWQAAAGGVPSLLYRNCSTPGASPSPYLNTLRLHVRLCRCVFVCWQTCAWMGMCIAVPTDHHLGTCRGCLMLPAPLCVRLCVYERESVCVFSACVFAATPFLGLRKEKGKRDKQGWDGEANHVHQKTAPHAGSVSGACQGVAFVLQLFCVWVCVCACACVCVCVWYHNQIHRHFLKPFCVH